MRVVSDQARLQDLTRYLREGGCIIEQVGPKALDVFVPSVPDYRQARKALGVRLSAWRIQNPGVETKLLTPSPRGLTRLLAEDAAAGWEARDGDPELADPAATLRSATS